MVTCRNRDIQANTLQPLETLAQLIIAPMVQAQYGVLDACWASDRATGRFGTLYHWGVEAHPAVCVAEEIRDGRRHSKAPKNTVVSGR